MNEKGIIPAFIVTGALVLALLVASALLLPLIIKPILLALGVLIILSAGLGLVKGKLSLFWISIGGPQTTMILSALFGIGLLLVFASQFNFAVTQNCDPISDYKFSILDYTYNTNTDQLTLEGVTKASRSSAQCQGIFNYALYVDGKQVSTFSNSKYCYLNNTLGDGTIVENSQLCSQQGTENNKESYQFNVALEPGPHTITVQSPGQPPRNTYNEPALDYPGAPLNIQVCGIQGTDCSKAPACINNPWGAVGLTTNPNFPGSEVVCRGLVGCPQICAGALSTMGTVADLSFNVASTPFCGDGFCSVNESSQSCALDCGAPPAATCGNFVCEQSETVSSCNQDCGTSGPTTFCGNLICEAGENPRACPNDCFAPIQGGTGIGPFDAVLKALNDFFDGIVKGLRGLVVA